MIYIIISIIVIIIAYKLLKFLFHKMKAFIKGIGYLLISPILLIISPFIYETNYFLRILLFIITSVLYYIAVKISFYVSLVNSSFLINTRILVLSSYGVLFLIKTFFDIIKFLKRKSLKNRIICQLKENSGMLSLEQIISNNISSNQESLQLMLEQLIESNTLEIALDKIDGDNNNKLYKLKNFEGIKTDIIQGDVLEID